MANKKAKHVKKWHSLLGSSSDQIFGTPKKYGFSEGFLSIDSHGLFKKIPSWRYHLVIFSNYFLSQKITKGSTRKGQFREVVAKTKRCIFLHIENEKLILGPYEEVHISAFFKKLFGLQ